jgi:hypothetical protein
VDSPPASAISTPYVLLAVENKKEIMKASKPNTIVVSETTIKLKEQDSHAGQIPSADNEDLKVKAKRAGESVSDLVDSSIDRVAQTLTRANSLLTSGVLDPGYVLAKRDSADIARLGRPLVTVLATAFEDTITMVRQHPYDEQEKILTGYKKLMEEQINVINSRIGFVKRVR